MVTVNGTPDRVPVDLGRLFHPETIGQARAHQRRQPGTCAKDDAHNKAERQRIACTCQPDPGDLDAIWAGRARMARARRNTGQALDDLDRQALERQASDFDIEPPTDLAQEVQPW